MGNSLYTNDYDEYLSALEKLIEAQKNEKGIGALFPLKSGENAPELVMKGKEAFQRLNNVYGEYAKKYQAWKDSMKAHGL